MKSVLKIEKYYDNAEHESARMPAALQLGICHSDKELTLFLYQILFDSSPTFFHVADKLK